LPAISYTSSTAETQGQAAAYDANVKLGALGFPTGTIVYYDMEFVSGSSQACITAMTYFIKGWDEGLHGYGQLAGYYGSACGPSIDNFAISIPPDDIWFRDVENTVAGGENTSAYTSDDTSVANSSGCIAHWSTGHRRIRQFYAGPGAQNGYVFSHDGYTYNLDYDCSGGVVDAQLQVAYGC
jgi:hypothetical protein